MSSQQNFLYKITSLLSNEKSLPNPIFCVIFDRSVEMNIWKYFFEGDP